MICRNYFFQENIMFKKPHAHIMEKTAAIVPQMRWDGKENFSSWQEKAGKKLTELLGLPFQKCDDKFQIEYQVSHETFNETRFVFQSEEGFFVPCHFWMPKNISGSIPLVICLQGHTTGMHISMGRPIYPPDEERIKGGERDFAVRVIKEGYCALVMEQRCFGELGDIKEKGSDYKVISGTCTVSTMAALLIGRTVIGERVWDLQRALDVTLKKFQDIDKSKIICTGNSGGGNTAFFARCLDPRITYPMPSSYFCSFDDSIGAMYHCPCNYVPNIRLFFDTGDLAGLIAPRPLVIVSGLTDQIFPQAGVYKAFNEAQRMYTGAGAADKIKLVVGEGGHRFYADLAWEAMNSFLKE
jgi:cephalosporin-C deacetylase-like acetyl esterase